MSKYRKIFEEYYGVKIPNGFDIHHIDGDRNNNDISNLLMLPHTLHAEYHEWCFEYTKLMSTQDLDCKLCGYNQHKFMVIEEFGKVLEKCREWILYKANLDQRIFIENL